MKFMDFFQREPKTTATVARDRLKIILAHERSFRDQPDFLPRLQQELLDVVRRYVEVEQDQVQVHLESRDTCSVLELNVTLPERDES